VIVRGGKIVGRGATAAGGAAACGDASARGGRGPAPRGATAYVSFEPCAHQGADRAMCGAPLIEAKGSRASSSAAWIHIRKCAGAELRCSAAREIATHGSVSLEAECRRMVEGFISQVDALGGRS